MIFLSVMGLLTMATSGEDKYIIFPIAMLIWALYTFFDEDDKEYVRRHETSHRKSYNDWFGYDGYYGDNSRYYPNTATNKPKTIVITSSSEAYKKIVKRCRKSVNITIDKINSKNKKIQ
jgi:hypothetical protein